MPSTSTHYEVLGLPHAPTHADIRNAYKTLSLRHHPDKPKGNATQFSRIQLAYEVLSDVKRRTAYDGLLRHVVTDVVSLDDLKRENGEWFMECRCGGEFVIEEGEGGRLGVGVSVIGCDTCSLAIRVVDVGKLEGK